MTCNAGNCISARILIAALLCGVIGLTATALAAPSAASVDLNAEQRALIAQLTADKAITVALEPQQPQQQPARPEIQVV
jgi:hypothetical protein